MPMYILIFIFFLICAIYQRGLTRLFMIIYGSVYDVAWKIYLLFVNVNEIRKKQLSRISNCKNIDFSQFTSHKSYL